MFYAHSILTEDVFVTQLPSNMGTSVWLIVWVTTNCRFMSDMTCVSNVRSVTDRYFHENHSTGYKDIGENILRRSCIKSL